MQRKHTKGLKFISRRKAEVDLARHSDIMEDAIDRIKVKEAMNPVSLLTGKKPNNH